MARHRHQGPEGEARIADRAEMAEWVASGYPQSDARDELLRRERSRRVVLPRGHRIDPLTELHEILLPCHECGRPIEDEDSDHKRGCRYYAAPIQDRR